MKKWVYRTPWWIFISFIVINFFHPNIYIYIYIYKILYSLWKYFTGL